MGTRDRPAARNPGDHAPLRVPADRGRSDWKRLRDVRSARAHRAQDPARTRVRDPSQRRARVAGRSPPLATRPDDARRSPRIRPHDLDAAEVPLSKRRRAGARACVPLCPRARRLGDRAAARAVARRRDPPLRERRDDAQSGGRRPRSGDSALGRGIRRAWAAEGRSPPARSTPSSIGARRPPRRTSPTRTTGDIFVCCSWRSASPWDRGAPRGASPSRSRVSKRRCPSGPCRSREAIRGRSPPQPARGVARRTTRTCRRHPGSTRAAACRPARASAPSWRA